MATELTARQRAFLQTVLSDASAEVSDKISRWAGRGFSVKFLDVGYVPLADIAGAAGAADLRSAAALLSVHSPVGGHILFVLPELSARVFVDLLLGRPAGGAGEWGEAERSVIMETGNILGSAFINILAGALDKPISTSTPVFFIDYPGAILQQAALEYALEGDEALLARARFSRDDLNFEESFVFIPAPGFLKAVDACLDARGTGGGR